MNANGTPFMSVVVPVYNVEPYLPRCLDSILSQSLHDFEVICINDASSDGSLEVLRAYAAKDSRVTVIDFEQNQGVGAARNRGIREASGETICFVDPDDLLPEKSLEKRAEAYSRDHAVVKGRRVDMTPTGQVTRVDTYGEELTQKLFCPRKALPHIDLLDHHTAWLFPKMTLDNEGVEYKEGMRNGQDLYFLASIFYHIDKMICINDPVYVVVHRQGSSTNRGFSAENYINIIKCADIFYKKSFSFQQPVFADCYFNKRIVHALTRMVEKSSGASGEEEDLKLFIDYGLYIYNKYTVSSRLNDADMQKFFPGIFLLLKLVTEDKGSVRYRIHKAQKKLIQQGQI